MAIMGAMEEFFEERKTPITDTEHRKGDDIWTFPKDFRIEETWFDRKSRIHGKGHTLRVMILADTLYKRALKAGFIGTPGGHGHEESGQSGMSYQLDEPAILYRDLMAAALIHDLARRHDGYCTEHGRWAAETKRPIAEKYLGFSLSEGEWAAIAGAVTAHSRPDPKPPSPSYRPGSLTALLKDADGLDRVRLYDAPDPAYFRHPFTAEYIDFAWELLDTPISELEKTVANLSLRI